MSNGRTELAVKATKLILMENVCSNGEVVNDRMVQALLRQRNTAELKCKPFRAQIILGQNLKD